MPSATAAPSTQTTATAPSRARGVVAVVDRFVREMDSLATTLPITMMLVASRAKVKLEALEEFLAQNGKPEEGKENRFTVPVDMYQEFSNVRRDWQRSTTAVRIIPRSFLTSLVSQYDGFLGNLLQSLFYLKPELLNSSERSLSFRELLDFPDIERAREYVAEKEIEALLRQSHCDQFSWMENKFKIPLRKDLACWPTFVEVTERRNLFVHCNGVVSLQYLKICAENNASCQSAKQGTELHVGPDYFREAYETILEIGVKLASVLWRKLRPDQRDEADNHLNDVCLNLIRDEKFKVAQKLLDFAAGLKKFSDETSRRIFILNRAQAYKWSGDEKKARSIIAADDWKASNEKFRLGVAVLLDDFDRAAKIMKQIGADGEPRKGDYKEWPIFKQFRQSKQFATAYTEVFGEPWMEVAGGGDGSDNADEASATDGTDDQTPPTVQ